MAGAVVPLPPRAQRGHQFDLGWSEKTLLGRGYLICPRMGAKFKQAEKTVEHFLRRKIPEALKAETVPVTLVQLGQAVKWK